MNGVNEKREKRYEAVLGGWKGRGKPSEPGKCKARPVPENFALDLIQAAGCSRRNSRRGVNTPVLCHLLRM